MSDSSEMANVFAENGVLNDAIDGFRYRPAQQTMAVAVEESINDRSILICEAGTGTGKTFAYVIPALLSQKKIIISTGTKNLQDQLFHRDIPVIRSTLAIPAKIVLLKGRSNYICHYRLKQNSLDGRFHDPETVEEFQDVVEWATYTKSGDIGELSDIPERSAVWPLVTSTADNCLGSDCPDYQECFLVKARQQAKEADIVVINHHLFFADLSLKDDGFGELLPGADAIILDEAHQLPEVANHFFGSKLSSRQILELCRDSQAEILLSAKDDVQTLQLLQRVETNVKQMRLALGRENQRGVWQDIKYKGQLRSVIETMQLDLQTLTEALAILAVRSKGLTACWERSLQIALQFKQLTGDTPNSQIHWYETFRLAFTIYFTPMLLADEFKQHIQSKRSAWVFTSATLTVAGQFEHFTKQLGVTAKQNLVLDSPFDFQQQTLMYLPQGLPQPNDPSYTYELMQAAIPVINASRGRTFLLFTSHRAVQQAATLLTKSISYPVLVQGSMPKTKLIDRFRRLGNAVLIGTSSFWEGVDVRGEALSCVIIDKLPFASPNDPILKARIKAMQQRGEEPFMDYQLPKAVLAFKQGIGRLIRDSNDRGVLMLADPRLQSKNYGKIFLDSIPTMPVTHDVADVRDFFLMNEIA